MKLDYRHLAFALIVAGGLSGCQGLWNDLFGSGSSSTQKPLGILPGEVVECDPPRDPNLPSLLANNVPCSADSQCPVGSFCTGNGVSGTCIRECGPDLPNCTGNRYCSCQGVCEEIGTPGRDAGGGSAPVTCERDHALLEQIKGNRACTANTDCLNGTLCDTTIGRCKTRPCSWDTDCPNGSSCDRSIGRCNWSCNNPNTPCTGQGEQCNCYGQCISPGEADAGSTFLRKAFSLVVTPTTVKLAPGTGNSRWTRTMHVSLETRDATTLVQNGSNWQMGPTVSTADQQVNVRPGANLRVSCDDGSTYPATGCTLAGPWTFTRDGDTWKSDRVIRIQPAEVQTPPDAGAFDDWTIHVAGSITDPGVQDLTVDVQSAIGSLAWVLEPTFVQADYRSYSGTVHFVTPFGKGGAVNGGVQAGVDVPVKARMHECKKWTASGASEDWVCLTISDPSTIMTDKETVTLYLHGKANTQDRGGSTWQPDPFLEFGCATSGTGMKGMVRTRIELALEKDPNAPSNPDAGGSTRMVTSLRRSDPGSRLTGRFVFGKDLNRGGLPDWLSMEASFQLAPDSTFSACSVSNPCPGGLTCDPSGLCIRKKPSTGCTGNEGGQDYRVGHPGHWGSDIGNGTLREINTAQGAGTLPDSDTSHRGLYAYNDIWRQLYHIASQTVPSEGLSLPGSVFRAAPAAVRQYPRLLAPDILDFEMTRYGVNWPVDVPAQLADGLAAAAYDINQMLPDARLMFLVPATSGGYEEESAQVWATSIADRVKAAIFSGGSTEAYVPCIDADNPLGGGGVPGRSIADSPNWTADCGRYWENVKAVAMKSDSFTTDCTPTDRWLAVSSQEQGGAWVWYQVYVCPGIAKVLGGTGSATGSALVDSANRYLCQQDWNSTYSGLQANDIDPNSPLQARSKEFKCRDDYTGGSTPRGFRPAGVDLLTLPDSADPNDTGLDYGTLMRECLSDLEKDLTVPEWSPSSGSLDSERKDWLESVFVRRGCFSPAHFWTAYQTAKKSLTSKEEMAQKYFFDLVKKWLQVHGFILTQGLEEHKLARTEDGNKALQSGTTEKGADSEKPKLPPVSLERIIGAAEAGLGLLIADAKYDPAMGAVQGALRYPDWRPGHDNEKDKGDEQNVGLPVVLVETATKYLRVVEEYLQEAALEHYAETVDGAMPEALTVAQRKAGRALRLTSLIESIASAMNRVATGNVQPCTKSNEAQKCGGMACSKQDGTPGMCNGTSWTAMYEAATNEYLKAQQDVSQLAQSEMNPLGIDETDLPLFFGDLTGTNSRFFAASDYLINTWAVSAVQSAQGALDKARDAWVQRRNSTLQDEMNAAEEERRIEGIKTKYGEIIAANCGKKSRDSALGAIDLLEKAKDFFDPKGPKEKCHIDDTLKDEDGTLRCVPSPPVPGLSTYQQCVADKTAEATVSQLEQMGFFKKDFEDPQVLVPGNGSSTTVSWACRNYFHLNPMDTQENPIVNVRVGGGPLQETGHQMAQGISGFTWIRPEEKKDEIGHVLNGCDLMSPGSYAGISSKSAAGDNDKNALAVLRCKVQNGTNVVCDRPSPEELQKQTENYASNCICMKKNPSDSEGKLMGYRVDLPPLGHPNRDYLDTYGRVLTSSALGGLGRFFECRAPAGYTPCGGANTTIQWKQINRDPSQGGLGTCTSANTNNIKLIAETSSGAEYRACGQTECQSDDNSHTPWAYGADACGQKIPNGYGSDRWWPTGGGPTGGVYCLQDMYRQETCSRAAYKLAVAEQMKYLPIPRELTELVDQVCQNGNDVPVDMGSKKLTALPLPQECYLGLLGSVVVKGYGALEDVQLAKMAWGAAQNSYDIQGRVCAQIQDDAAKVQARQEAFASEMTEWRMAKLFADSLATAAQNAAGSGTSFGASNIATGFQQASMAIETQMQSAQMKFDNFMRSMTLQQQVRECFAEANKLQAQFEVQKGQIIRRVTDLAAAQQEFGRIFSDTERAYFEGTGALNRELGRKADAPRFEFHYWYEEKAERYLREFKWAKRLVYLAMRAVEYEFQQSLALRKSILTAQHPDQLEGAVRAMQAEVATRAINRRRPQELSVVLSLRDDVLGIVDYSKFQGSGERKATPIRAFQERLWDAKYSVYDKDGKWAGQGIPFTITPQAGLVDRCAERLWRVTATVQGDGLSETEPGATLRLLKKNTFSSQWCEGLGNGSKMQVGQLEPSKNLFRDKPGPGVAGENLAYSTAAIYPWFNVRRGDFYKTTYQDGASEELAGRGLYGDYILLFPAALLEGQEMPNPPVGELTGARIDQFPLNRVEDVLMRFDYLSVDNFAARGVQPNP